VVGRRSCIKPCGGKGIEAVFERSGRSRYVFCFPHLYLVRKGETPPPVPGDVWLRLNVLSRHIIDVMCVSCCVVFVATGTYEYGLDNNS